METAEEFHRAILEDRPALDVDRSRVEHVRVAGRLVADHPTVGAIVLECTNMPPYRSDIQRATGLPVFDIVHLVNLVHQALLP
jgi:Asp/Glu/hydantoin racemase